MKQTDLSIGGYEINDTAFLKKTALDFFHYARISMDLVFQIINFSLLGDQSIPLGEKDNITQIITKLNTRNELGELKELLNKNKKSSMFKYLQAFDNYTKHIKIILIVIENSIVFGDINNFYINEFNYPYKDKKNNKIVNVLYQKEDALNKIKQINTYVLETVSNILDEVYKQIPNCIDNINRIQDLYFKHQMKNDITEYIAFFIDVENDLSEFSQEIKVHPLMKRSDNKIYNDNFKFDKIFIKKRGCNESTIMGCADLKNSFEGNEFYSTFAIRPCNISEFYKYLSEFNEKHLSISFNPLTMTGDVIKIS